MGLAVTANMDKGEERLEVNRQDDLEDCVLNEATLKFTKHFQEQMPNRQGGLQEVTQVDEVVPDRDHQDISEEEDS